MSQIYLPGFPDRKDEKGLVPLPWPGYNPRPLPNDNRAAIKNLYSKELGREADKEGLDYWTKQLDSGSQTIDQITKNIQGSDEGRGYFLKNTYMDLLGREGDQGGMDYWDNELKSGKSRESIQENIFNSDEARTYRSKDRTRPPGGRGKEPKPLPPKDGPYPIEKPGITPPELVAPGRPRPGHKGPRRGEQDHWVGLFNQSKANTPGSKMRGFGQAILGGLTKGALNNSAGQSYASSGGTAPGRPGPSMSYFGGGGTGSKTVNAAGSMTTNFTNPQSPQSTSTGGSGGAKKDFGSYKPGTISGNLYNQGWGNMVDWGNKFKDNKSVQNFISGARLDADEGMMRMGMDLLYEKGQMQNRAEYIGGLENLKTGNTLKLMSAEGGILGDLQGQQGEIESRHIGQRGDQERRGLRVAGQEDRAGIKVQGDQDRKGIRVKGDEERMGMMEQGSQNRMGMAAQGIQDRMLTREKGDQERKTQRDRYREDRKMRADARGAIRSSGSRFFG